jgi:hypothetical protein
MRPMGYGHNLNLLITLHQLCVSFPTRSGCREKHIRLKASLDYCEEVHRPKFLGGGEWSNMIGNKQAGVYTIAKTYLVENFKHE